MSNGTLDIQANAYETEERTVLELVFKMGALQFSLRLNDSQRLWLLKMLAGAVENTAFPIGNFHCQPLPTGGARYLEIAPHTLGIRGAEK